jgi:hypothetical protein
MCYDTGRLHPYNSKTYPFLVFDMIPMYYTYQELDVENTK